MTFAEEIEEQAQPETIEAVVIGKIFEWGRTSERNESKFTSRVGEILAWAEARPLLDYPVGHGFGSPDCHPIAVYTATRIIQVCQYDGATDFFTTMRNPTAGVLPEMPGG